jgi:hypothetical protein
MNNVLKCRLFEKLLGHKILLDRQGLDRTGRNMSNQASGRGCLDPGILVAGAVLDERDGVPEAGLLLAETAEVPAGLRILSERLL